MVKQLHMARREENSRVGRMTQQICWICVCGTSTKLRVVAWLKVIIKR